MPSEVAPARHNFTYDARGRLASDSDVPDVGTGAGPNQGLSEPASATSFPTISNPVLVDGPLANVRTVTLTSPAVAASAGLDHSCALVVLAAGGHQAWCWGANGAGQLGPATAAASSAVPVLVPP
jgi:alpha-tubulin suppressor-like RCC1 family protein